MERITPPVGRQLPLLKRILLPGFTEMPECRCGQPMHAVRVEPTPQGGGAHIRVYNCPGCRHEMRLNV